MLINTIIKESADGTSLKAEIRTNDEVDDYSVKYYINGQLNKITRYPLKTEQEVNEHVEDWIKNMQILNG